MPEPEASIGWMICSRSWDSVPSAPPSRGVRTVPFGRLRRGRRAASLARSGWTLQTVAATPLVHSERRVGGQPMELGRVGVWLGPRSLRPAAKTRGIAREVEELGFGAIWFGEGVGTKECFTQAATLLAWTARAVVATGIANIYARDP